MSDGTQTIENLQRLEIEHLRARLSELVEAAENAAPRCFCCKCPAWKSTSPMSKSFICEKCRRVEPNARREEAKAFADALNDALNGAINRLKGV